MDKGLGCTRLYKGCTRRPREQNEDNNACSPRCVDKLCKKLKVCKTLFYYRWFALLESFKAYYLGN